MNETVISWTVSNWITVFLMVFLGFALIGLVARFYASAKAKATGDA